ncbi:MAG: polysaccharide biosynthesis tyrosine autokinase [Bacteroidaceae bacterium]|nr:polysaccharide biosynthesis tyrosine autokinase [Bacteroidaceae bacterium]
MADYLLNDMKEEDESSSSFNLKSLITIIYLNWYWILLSALVCFAAAKLYLRYTAPVYSADMKMFIKESGTTKRGSGTGALEEIGIISNSSGFDNELQILTSTAIASRNVRTLKLYTSYRMEGKIVDQELYKNSPIIVDLAESSIDQLKNSIHMTISQKKNGLHVEGTIDGGNAFARDLAELPATVHSAVGPIIFQRNAGYEMPSDRKLYVTIDPLITTARRYAGRVRASGVSTSTSVANLHMEDTHMGRALDYLGELINSYNEDANEDKNMVARKTEDFINERIDVIRRELDSTEVNLETYKRSHELINLANNATSALSGSSSYQREQVDIQTQLTLLKSLIDYVNNPGNMLQVIPSNLGLSNSQLSSSINNYNQLVAERTRLLKTSTESNPTVARLTAQLEDLWPNIGTSLRTIYQDLLVQKSSIDNQYQMYNSRVANTPTQERVLTNISRQQEIKAGLYLMLLQKREQNYISLASIASKARVIDEPKPTGKVSPDDRKIKASAVALGLLLPIAIIFILSLLRYRIEGREDIQRLTKLPILADIPLTDSSKSSNGIVVAENKNGMMEEAFRGLRTNMSFVLPEPEKVVVCTSCIPGEGKTFVASNLAMSLSLLNKRVLLVGLDIRKPRLNDVFQLGDSKKGITSFLMLEKPDYDLLEEQISREVVNKNLDILPAGIIPPNPTELISRHVLDEAIAYLRTKYDYIILDTPPVGLVSDTLELGRTADATIFVTRADYSIKANFELINNISRDKKLPKVNLVLNGINLQKRKYGYYYGYGKYGSYGKKGKYGYYGTYSHYGHYGVYGDYNEDGKGKKGKKG